MSVRFDGQIWAPSTFTPPLREDFTTDGDTLLKVVDLAWTTGDGTAFKLDDWQKAVIRHALETYPEDWPDESKRGQLRYRTVVISMGRQNGKSVLGAILALYGLLLHQGAPEILSIASSVEQARIVYERLRTVIDSSPSLRKKYKATGTRGISSRNPAKPASYVVKAGKEETLQGYPISLCLADELHLWKETTYDAVRLGTSARGGTIIGITTAGDDNSEILKRLYEHGRQAAALDGEYDERLGFFCWEMPSGVPVASEEALIAANPAIACGRLPLQDELDAVRRMPENQAKRYRGNVFVESESAWLPGEYWTRCEKATIPDGAPYVLAVDRAENWTYASVVAAAKVDGHVVTEVVASLVNPTHESLEEIVRTIAKRRRPTQVVMEVAVLKDLAASLRESGLPIEYYTQGQVQAACATAYALLSEKRVSHAHDPLLSVQMPKAAAKNMGDAWRISRRDSSGDVDAVIATVLSLYAAETVRPKAPALFVA